MEESSPVLALHASVRNSLCSDPMEITHYKLMADAASLLSDSSEPKLTPEGSGSCNSLDTEVHDVAEMVEGGDTEDLETRALPGCEDKASVVSIDMEQLVESSCLTIRDDGSIITAAKELLDSNTALIGVSGCIEAAVKSIITGVEIISGSSIGKLSASLVNISPESDGLKLPPFADINIHEGLVSLRGRRCVFALDYTPLWGCMSTCGRRPEMEDAAISLPLFHEIPLSMLTSGAVMGDVSMNSGCLPGHFFGVYDGHGGAQVANYCKDRMHFALADEIKNINRGAARFEGDGWQQKWETAFINCFRKVDDEVSGGVSKRLEGSTSSASFDDTRHSSAITLETIVPETVGSTAVVAVICSSHIIVANCGDSRAVLYCGKQAIPLSVDHKPDREDEYQRIEEAGGKVIQWYGSRVFGVLAMSRSIGDRYLKPWIIPDPEVIIVPRAREDECLILASDGLWDVMSNEEACDVARKRILLWHKKNSGVTCSTTRRDVGADPAAQEAADYLSKLALQKGSKDNITIVVVDLKAHRKFKSKT